MNNDESPPKAQSMPDQTAKAKSPKEAYLELLERVPVDDKEEFFILKARIHIGIPQVKDETKRKGFISRFQGVTSGQEFKYIGSPTAIFKNHTTHLDQIRNWGGQEKVIDLIMTEEYNKLKGGLEQLDMEIRAELRAQGDLGWADESEEVKAFKKLLEDFETGKPAEKKERLADGISKELDG